MKNLLRKTKGQRRSSGFTLVELVVVVAVVGVLGAVAVPKLVSVGGEARLASLTQVAGSLAAGSATNYAKRQVGGYTAGSAVARCAHVSNLLGGSGLDAAFTLMDPAGSVQNPVTNGAKSTCKLYTSTKPYTNLSFEVYGTGTTVEFDAETLRISNCADTSANVADVVDGFQRADDCTSGQQI